MSGRKRAASSSFEASEPRRRSGRISSAGKSSVYFEADSDEGEDEIGAAGTATSNGKTLRGKLGRRRAKEDEQDAYEEGSDSEGQASESAAAEEEAEDEGGEEEEEGSRGRPRKEKSRSTVSKRKRQEADGDDEDEDEDSAEPRVTFVPHAKLRGAGGIAYEDDRLHQNTLLFLKDLKANNKRSWLKGRASVARGPWPCS
jgi:hypothetical protein